MIRKLIILLNPAAGKGAAADKVDEIHRRLKEAGAEYLLLPTERPGHAREMAAEFAAAKENSETVIVSAGGDGTANETLNGLMRDRDARKSAGRPQPVFGVLPIGRGNDMAYGLGIPSDWREALNRLGRGDLRPMDVGRVTGGDFPEGLWFGNGIGVGFDAIVGFEAAKMTRLHGAAGYTIGALKTIITYPAAPKTSFTAGDTVERLTPAIISIMNGRRMGGSFFMAPDAEIDDGMLDWCHTDQGPRLRLLSALAAYAGGRHRERPDTSSGRAARISIQALEGTLAAHADGETVCESGKSLEIDLAAGALRLSGSRSGGESH